MRVGLGMAVVRAVELPPRPPGLLLHEGDGEDDALCELDARLRLPPPEPAAHWSPNASRDYAHFFAHVLRRRSVFVPPLRAYLRQHSLAIYNSLF